MRPTLDDLIANKDKNKQRAAAEFIAGTIDGVVICSRGRWVSADETHRLEALAYGLPSQIVEVVHSTYQNNLQTEEQRHITRVGVVLRGMSVDEKSTCLG